MKSQAKDVRGERWILGGKKKEQSRQCLVRMRLVRKRGSCKQSRCGAEEEDAMPGYII